MPCAGLSVAQLCHAPSSAAPGPSCGRIRAEARSACARASRHLRSGRQGPADSGSDMRQKRRQTRRSISPCMIMAEDAALRQHDKVTKKGPQGNGPVPRSSTAPLADLATTDIRARRLALRSLASAGSEKLRLRHQGIKIGRSQAECDVAFTPGLQIVPAVRAHVVKGLGGRGAALRRKRRKKRALDGKLPDRRCMRHADHLRGLAQ